MDNNSITEYLKSSLSLKRFIHSINVSSTAVKLAEFYGCNSEKAGIAGLVHDCARELDRPLLLDCIAKEGIIVDDLTLSIKELLHGPAAVHICRKVFDIKDEDILSAVSYHTTGKENMTLLEKIIYLSDFIEPSRCFEGVEELRGLAFRNLDEALLLAFNLSIEYIISKNAPIHVNTILSRNYVLKGIQKI
ncbi:MAG TPA: bis(5'-nucleosyl)-tetraphosphatase (symmetrical) YqeK [Clostridia bacterium]|nr:bis(5'-nucleosyl)-tetraphosphatase (symmetrical) YqeK [Clostridia bacterium]